MDQDGGHADGGHWRNSVRFVLDNIIWVETLKALGDDVADAEIFAFDRGAGGKLFELSPFRWRGRVFRQWCEL